MTGVGNPTKRKIIYKVRPQDGIGNPTKRKIIYKVRHRQWKSNRQFIYNKSMTKKAKTI